VKKTLLKKTTDTMMWTKKPSLIALLLAVVFSLGIATTFTNDQGKYFEISKNIEIFVNLYKELNTNYVDELDPSGLMHTGIDAMLQSLDPYTNYITESQIETYRFATEGKYHGIGAQIEVMDDYITITEPYENSPAVRSGLKAGDQVIAIEGKSTKGKTPDEVNAILMGYPGTSIRLTVKRPGEPKELTIDLERGEVDVPNVPYYGMVSDDIGYISLTTFSRNAGGNVARAFKSLKSENENLKGIIFDLRGNGGGFLHEAVNICNIFIPQNELVVSTKGKVTERDRNFNTMSEPMDTEIPLVVLINNRSASASEIVSGVIQDYDRGILLG
jgi:carboxyl-terminal processing protease